jgi:hypothetical protein
MISALAVPWQRNRRLILDHRLAAVELVYEAALLDLTEKGVIDELLRLGGFGAGVTGEVQHGLDAGGGNVGNALPNLDESLVGFVEVFLTGRFRKCADDLLVSFGLVAA